jgi:8-oxo-dGTP diphosphatase
MEDTKQHFLGKITQKAIIENQGKILVCRGVGDTVWEFPGGRLHAGEIPLEGIVREIYEELGIKLKDLKTLSLHPSFNLKSNTHQVLVAYLGVCENREVRTASNEVEEIRWVSREELASLPMFEDCEAAKESFLR